MSVQTPRVAVITGASQGIGASLVAAYTVDDYDLVTGVNLRGFHITRRAIEHMAERGAGHIINITTTLVEHADVSQSAGH
jgi:NAD(P)-dependent dehydrogenase (short-subunit alcohol dehydrogenase family)